MFVMCLTSTSFAIPSFPCRTASKAFADAFFFGAVFGRRLKPAMVPSAARCARSRRYKAFGLENLYRGRIMDPIALKHVI